MRYRVRVLVLALFALDVMGAVQTSCFSPTLGVPNAVHLGRDMANTFGRRFTIAGKAAVAKLRPLGNIQECIGSAAVAFFVTMRRACVTWMLGADGGGELVKRAPGFFGSSSS